MVDVVVTKALTDHLLKQVGFFICAFCRSKARNASTADLFHTLCREVQRFVPRRFAEMGLPITGVDVQPLGRGVVAADQLGGADGGYSRTRSAP